jgi:cation transport ATPase
MAYTVKCVRCHQDWTGFGMVCNQCKQLESLDKLNAAQARSSKNQYQPSEAELRLQESLREARRLRELEEAILDARRTPEERAEVERFRAQTREEIEAKERKFDIIFTSCMLLFVLWVLSLGNWFLLKVAYVLVSIVFAMIGAVFSILF